MMINDIYEKIINGIDIKKNLQLLKDVLKEDKLKGTHNRDALIYHIGEDANAICSLLNDSNPKIRKNAAAVLEQLAIQKTLIDLFAAYNKEQTNFVKSSYLAAIGSLNYKSILNELIRKKDELVNTKLTVENKKHITEEVRELISLINNYEGKEKHCFTGYNLINELVLLTNRNHKTVTTVKLQGLPHKAFTAGVMVKTDHLKEVLTVRTYQELLFVPDTFKSCPCNAEEAAAVLIDNGIYDYICKRHDTSHDASFNFRIEAKCSDKDDEKNIERKMGVLLEQLSGWKLVNSVNNYELEIRLIETRSKSLNVLIKFYTLPDTRFLYRQESISAGIKPCLAALCIELASPYLHEDSAVLDPFCGTGTMLIERRKHLPVMVMYGVDIYGEAVAKAKINTSLADMNKNSFYITRDYFDFIHEYLFDEVITDMPFITGGKETPEIEAIYKRFFIKIKCQLKENGVIVMYSHNKNFARRYSQKENLQIIKEYEISMVEGSYLFIFKKG